MLYKLKLYNYGSGIQGEEESQKREFKGVFVVDEN